MTRSAPLQNDTGTRRLRKSNHPPFAQSLFCRSDSLLDSSYGAESGVACSPCCKIVRDTRHNPPLCRNKIPEGEMTIGPLVLQNVETPLQNCNVLFCRHHPVVSL